MKPGERIEPFFFGPDAQLFGCLHTPANPRCRDFGWLICQPIGHEYVNSHRALRQLAARLCEAGFPVLRFDYFGCGDSAGETCEGSIAQWLNDVATATAELNQRIGASRVGLAGLRLGATLALLAAAVRDDVASVIVWDPVLKGSAYLRELNSLESEMLRLRPRPKRVERNSSDAQLLGFSFTAALCAEIAQLDLTASVLESLPNLLMIESGPAPELEPFAEHASRMARSFQRKQFNAVQPWLPTQDGSLPVPHQILQSVVAWARTSQS